MKRHSISIKRNFQAICAAFCLTILLAASGFAQKTTQNYYAHLTAEHAAVVKNYIGKQTNLRPAQTSDCKNKFGLDSLRQSAGKSAHPYYAAADFNQDKIKDFSVVLYDGKAKTTERFTILIFDGAKSGAYKLAHKTVGVDLRQGGIWTYGFSLDKKKTTVTVGEYETDDCFWIEWDGKKYVAHDCGELEENAN